MAQTVFYRYVTQGEAQYIDTNSMIQSRSGVTYFAQDPPSRYDRRDDVTTCLAVPSPKDLRVGPIPADEAPNWDIVPPRTVSPQQLPSGRWVPGGGVEAATSSPHRLYGKVTLV